VVNHLFRTLNVSTCLKFSNQTNEANNELKLKIWIFQSKEEQEQEPIKHYFSKTI